MNRELTFDLTIPKEANAFGAVIASLNAAGVPIEIFQDSTEATIRIGTGY